MNNFFFTSDWHLFHKRIQEFCSYSRKGSSPEEMSKLIVQNVLSTLSCGDTLYNLGDVSFGSEQETFQLLMQIKNAGIKHILILGNHDHRIKKSEPLQSCFDEIYDDLDLEIGKKNYIVLNHFPKKVWHRSHHGAYHLYGHSHSQYQPVDGQRSMDIGIDTRASGDMKPYSLQEIESRLKYFDYGIHHR